MASVTDWFCMCFSHFFNPAAVALSNIDLQCLSLMLSGSLDSKQGHHATYHWPVQHWVAYWALTRSG